MKSPTPSEYANATREARKWADARRDLHTELSPKTAPTGWLFRLIAWMCAELH